LQDVTLKDDLPIKYERRKVPHHKQVEKYDTEKVRKDVFLKLKLHAGVQRFEPQIKEFEGKAIRELVTFFVSGSKGGPKRLLSSLKTRGELSSKASNSLLLHEIAVKQHV